MCKKSDAALRGEPPCTPLATRHSQAGAGLTPTDAGPGVQARVVLNTSTSEGMCNSLLEAMLVGTPVLARTNPGNAALLGHGDAIGLLFETADELVQRAEALLADAALGARLAQAAAAHIARHHSVQAETEGYRAALQRALDSPEGVLRGRSAGHCSAPLPTEGPSVASIAPPPG